MEYHVFNIGKPHSNEWWRELVQREVITTGFLGEPNDRGDVILHDMAEGDWIIAYCNRRGYVGAGIVSSIDSYVLFEQTIPGSQSNHLHERKVDWLYTVTDIANAVTLKEVGQSAPRQTKERERDTAVAEQIINLLKIRSPAKKAAKHTQVLSAVRAIGTPCNISEITEQLSKDYPGEGHGNTREYATLLTVNDANRRHYDQHRKSFRTDTGYSTDVLFRVGAHSNVTYELYDPIRHGVWDILPTPGGHFQAIQIDTTQYEQDLVVAHMQEAAEPCEPITTEADARRRQQGAIVVREGQGQFKTQLLTAYNRRCAITGCAVVEILEAAHIKPYLGPHTNRVDNGLLLRADIHTLFDKGLIWIDDNLHIQISERLHGSEYNCLAGKALRCPSNREDWPHLDHIAAHRTFSGH